MDSWTSDEVIADEPQGAQVSENIVSNQVPRLDAISMKLISVNGLPSLRILALRSKAVADACSFVKNFSDRFVMITESPKVDLVEAHNVENLEIEAGTAHFVYSPAKAVDESKHKCRTKPSFKSFSDVFQPAPSLKHRVFGRKQARLDSAFLTPSMKRKPSNQSSSLKQPRMDDVLVKLANCSLATASPALVPEEIPAVPLVPGPRDDFAVPQSQEASFDTASSDGSQPSLQSDSSSASSQSDSSSVSSLCSPSTQRYVEPNTSDQPTLAPVVLMRCSSNLKQKNKSLKKSQLKKLPDAKQKLLSSYFATLMDGGEKSD